MFTILHECVMVLAVSSNLFTFREEEMERDGMTGILFLGIKPRSSGKGQCVFFLIHIHTLDK